MSHIGEIAALGAAFIWTISAILFDLATKRINVLVINVVRLLMAVIILMIVCKVFRGSYFPTDATPYQWFYLSLSGIIGFVFGDWCLLKSFEKSGSRFSVLMLASNPAIAAILGYFFLNELQDTKSIIAMSVTFLGIVIAILARNKKGHHPITLLGVLYGLGASVGQATGFILSKKGMGSYNALAATEIRVLAGFVCFLIIMIIQRQTVNAIKSLKNKDTMILLTVATFLGTCVGVGLSLYAIQHTRASVASSIMSIIPILIIIPSVVLLQQKTSFGEVIGAFVSVVGIILFFV